MSPVIVRSIVVLLAACSTSTPASKPSAGSATTPDVDRGTFAISVRGKVIANETFSFTRQGANVVLRVSEVGVGDRKDRSSVGELELDATYRPVRAEYRKLTPADAFTYKLGGTPLTLDVTRDDNAQPQHVVAAAPIDVYVDGPGLAALAPLCTVVTGDVLLDTLGDDRSSWPRWLEAYRGAPVGTLQRIVVDASDEDLELLCDGPRLVAGGFAKGDVWFVRGGREADLAALKAAPRPTAHAWKHPVNEAEPWEPLHTFLFPESNIIVTRDRRARTNRLTVFSTTDGKEVTHRDFTVPLEAHVMCERLPKARLVCANSDTKYLRIVDAKTLADGTDLFPALAAATKLTDEWHLADVDDKRLRISMFDSDTNVEIDVATGKAKAVPDGGYKPSPASPTACPSALGDPVVVGDAEWTIDTMGDTAELVRKKKKGGAKQPPIELPFDHPQLLRCQPKGGGAYLLTHDGEKSVLAALAPDGTVRWKTELGAHPSDPDVAGAMMVLTMSDEKRRVLGIDTATGKILWVASGPQPKP